MQCTRSDALPMSIVSTEEARQILLVKYTIYFGAKSTCSGLSVSGNIVSGYVFPKSFSNSWPETHFLSRWCMRPKCMKSATSRASVTGLPADSLDPQHFKC